MRSVSKHTGEEVIKIMGNASAAASYAFHFFLQDMFLFFDLLLLFQQHL